MQTQSIQTRLTWAFVGLAVVPLIIVGVLTVWQGISYKSESLRLQEQLAQRVSVEIQAFFTNVTSDLQLAIEMEGSQGLQAREPFGTMFILLSHEDIFEEVTILNERGDIINRVARLELVAQGKLGNYADHPEFEIPLQTGEIFYSPVRFDDVTGEPLMTIAVAIPDERTGATRGVLVAEVRLKNIWEIIARIPLGADQTVYIVDSQGRVVAHPNPSVVLRGTNYSLPAQSGIAKGLESQTALMAVDKIQLGSQVLTIVAEQGLVQALALPINLVTTTLVVAVLASFTAGILSVRSVRRIVRPIKDLAIAAHEIRDGNLTHRAPVVQADEVGELAETFNTMADQLEQTMQGLSTELVERQHITDELRQSEAKTRALLDAIPDTIFVMDTDATFLEFIPGLNFTPLIPPKEFIGKQAHEVLPAILADQIRLYIQRVLEQNELQVFEYPLALGTQQRHFEARLAPSGPGRILAVIREITIQKMAEIDKENLIQELRLKNLELDQFTHTVSHDLKSPLITLRGFLRFLEKDASEFNQELLKKDILRINESVDKMERMIKELLDLSRAGQLIGSPVEMQFEDVIEDALSRVQGRLEARQIRVEVRGEMPLVHGDRNRLVQVIQNLLDNSAKFMGDQENPLIEIGTRSENGNLIFFVCDNGMGILPQFHDKVFGIFDKLDARSDGTGIGLALVKKIIEAHGGRIWIHSDGPGKGTTVFFTLQ